MPDVAEAGGAALVRRAGARPEVPADPPRGRVGQTAIIRVCPTAPGVPHGLRGQHPGAGRGPRPRPRPELRLRGLLRLQQLHGLRELPELPQLPVSGGRPPRLTPAAAWAQAPPGGGDGRGGPRRPSSSGASMRARTLVGWLPWTNRSRVQRLGDPRHAERQGAVRVLVHGRRVARRDRELHAAELGLLREVIGRRPRLPSFRPSTVCSAPSLTSHLVPAAGLGAWVE